MADAHITRHIHPGAVLVDTTLPADILDRVIWGGDRHTPPVTVREHLAEVARMAILDALPSLPARIVDDGYAPLDAPLAGAVGCLA